MRGKLLGADERLVIVGADGSQTVVDRAGGSEVYEQFDYWTQGHQGWDGVELAAEEYLEDIESGVTVDDVKREAVPTAEAAPAVTTPPPTTKDRPTTQVPTATTTQSGVRVSGVVQAEGVCATLADAGRPGPCVPCDGGCGNLKPHCTYCSKSMPPAAIAATPTTKHPYQTQGGGLEACGFPGCMANATDPVHDWLETAEKSYTLTHADGTTDEVVRMSERVAMATNREMAAHGNPWRYEETKTAAPGASDFAVEARSELSNILRCFAAQRIRALLAGDPEPIQTVSLAAVCPKRFAVVNLATDDQPTGFDTLEEARGGVAFDKLTAWEIWDGDTLVDSHDAGPTQ